MNYRERSVLSALILSWIPEGKYITWQEIVEKVKAETECRDMEEVRRLLAYHRVTGSIQQAGVLAEKYTKAPVRVIHP